MFFAKSTDCRFFTVDACLLVCCERDASLVQEHCLLHRGLLEKEERRKKRKEVDCAGLYKVFIIIIYIILKV